MALVSEWSGTLTRIWDVTGPPSLTSECFPPHDHVPPSDRILPSNGHCGHPETVVGAHPLVVRFDSELSTDPHGDGFCAPCDCYHD